MTVREVISFDAGHSSICTIIGTCSECYGPVGRPLSGGKVDECLHCGAVRDGGDYGPVIQMRKAEETR